MVTHLSGTHSRLTTPRWTRFGQKMSRHFVFDADGRLWTTTRHFISRITLPIAHHPHRISSTANATTAILPTIALPATLRGASSLSALPRRRRRRHHHRIARPGLTSLETWGSCSALATPPSISLRRVEGKVRGHHRIGFWFLAYFNYTVPTLRAGEGTY